MKKCWLLAALLPLLLGCGAEESFETVADEIIQPVMAQPRQIAVDLPESAVVPVLESDSEHVYLYEDYALMIETLSSRDLNVTVQSICGHDIEDLTVMQTQQGEALRYAS